MLHRATLHPTKLELLAAWLPGRRWHQGHDTADLVRVANCRFDDPAAAVGIETRPCSSELVTGAIYHVPLLARIATVSECSGHEYIGRGTLAYLAAYDVHRAHVMGRCESTTGIVPFTALVDQVMNQEPWTFNRDDLHRMPIRLHP